MMAGAASAPARGAAPAARGRSVGTRVPVVRPAAPRAHRADRRFGPTRPVRQRGAALVVALVLLIATSVLAVSTLSGTRMSEAMASNAQNKAIAFEAAESGIEAAWDAPATLVGALGAAPGNDPGPQELDALQTELGNDYDQTLEALGGSSELDVGGTLTAQYCGETASRTGSEMSADLSVPGGSVSHVFDVTSDVEVGANGARATHVQRGAVNGPRIGRTGACPAP